MMINTNPLIVIVLLFVGLTVRNAHGFVPLHGGYYHPLSSLCAFVGPVQESVQEALMEEFLPSHLEVINESHGNVEDESHFKVIIVSDAFQDARLVQRHRLINGCLMKDNNGELPFHALTITAKTKEEWEADQSVPGSPACMGGH